ncbi:hypothetical protein [Shewanella sp. Iso12]|uniref:hypothetical protein n=1 Tax=Shewanella sp. Iso12 TaxID=1826753 RepID=UPI00143050CA|nr:hypothetical protein [Shewanella sp. Iso12]NJI86993.1 hypothetical protein [Shewanella sp. Iso12]
MEIELTQKRYNLLKLWGVVNLALGFLALVLGSYSDNLASLILAAIGIVSGGLMLTLSKEPLVTVRKFRVPVKPVNPENI